MKRKKSGFVSLKIGLQILNVSLVLIMIYLLRIFLVKLFHVIKYLTE